MKQAGSKYDSAWMILMSLKKGFRLLPLYLIWLSHTRVFRSYKHTQNFPLAIYDHTLIFPFFFSLWLSFNKWHVIVILILQQSDLFHFFVVSDHTIWVPKGCNHLIFFLNSSDLPKAILTSAWLERGQRCLPFVCFLSSIFQTAFGNLSTWNSLFKWLNFPLTHLLSLQEISIKVSVTLFFPWFPFSMLECYNT